MEEKREVAYAHKNVLQGPLKEDADELFYNSICNGLSTDIFFHGFEFDFDMTNINKQQLYDETSQELRMLSPSLFIQGSQCKC